MKQLDRLKHIYQALTMAPQTIDSLKDKLGSAGVSISVRQLYRDIQDVTTYFLKSDETLEQKSLEYNRKIWFLNKHTDAIPITNYDIDTYLLGVALTPMGLVNGRKASLQKIQVLFASHLSNSKIEHNANWDGNKLISSHFYEIPYGNHFEGNLDEILWATSNRRSIEVMAYQGDSVSLYKSLQFPFIFNPLQLIYHRGCFFVAGIIAKTDQCLVLDTFQITEYKLSNETFLVKQQVQKLEKDLKNRFGVTQNIDDKTYKIELEFASNTGSYVQTFYWHHSQQFEKLSNGNFKMKLSCGINRELLGWIYQWMGNVKIIKPAVLKEHYLQQLHMIEEVNQDMQLQYVNLYQPK